MLVMEDENDQELRIISTSFCDPYIMVLREDSSVIVLQADSNGEMEEIDRGDALLSTKWLSGCIHKSASTGNKPLVYLLSAEGGLHVRFLFPNQRADLLIREPGLRPNKFLRARPRRYQLVFPARLSDCRLHTQALICQSHSYRNSHGRAG